MILNFSDEALNDLDGIWVYTAQTWSEDQADVYIEKLERGLGIVQEQTSLLRPASNYLPDLFRFRVERHIAFITRTPETLLVERILHESMDFMQHLATFSRTNH